MNKILESLFILIGYIAALVFVAWIFWLTRNPWSFVLLFLMPLLRHTKKESDDE